VWHTNNLRSATGYRFFFYEADRRRGPDRINLENVRRGQFEGLREELKKNMERQPGRWRNRKCIQRPAVTVVGCAEISNRLQRESQYFRHQHREQDRKSVIRFSSGGLRYVKSMGVELKTRNLAQVSINLTDLEQTPIASCV